MTQSVSARFRLFLVILALTAVSCKGVSALLPEQVSSTSSAILASPSSLSPTGTQPVITPSPSIPPPTLSPRVLTATSTPSEISTPTVAAITSQRQAQVFEALWREIYDNYLYPDFNGIDWEVVHETYRSSIKAGIADEAFYLAMDEMVALLGDDHSVYFSPIETEAEQSRFSGTYEYSGIGIIHIYVPERNRLAIILVFPGSPADRAGLKIHDSILTVNEQPVLDENGLSGDSIPGPPGTSITLTVQTHGELPRQIVLVREPIRGELPLPASVLQTGEQKRIGYILLPTFDDVTVSNRFADVLSSLYSDGNLDGLILDNRVNNGGADIVMNEILSYFVDGEVGSYASRSGEMPVLIHGKDLENSQSIPLVILVGRNSVSYGEIFPGILQDQTRAFIIGETTDGNVEILSAYSFKDGSSAWIATDIFHPYNHPDWNWEETGIIPDQTIVSEWDLISGHQDPVVEAALRYFDSR